MLFLRVSHFFSFCACGRINPILEQVSIEIVAKLFFPSIFIRQERVFGNDHVAKIVISKLKSFYNVLRDSYIFLDKY